MNFRRSDKASETGKAIRCHHDDHEVKAPFKFDMMSDGAGGTVYYDVTIPPENQDGKYHWYKFGPAYDERK